MFLSKIKVLLSHGKQYITDLDKAQVSERFRGVPSLREGVDASSAKKCVDLCPMGAIAYDGELSLDLGRCTFCGECAASFPDLVSFTNNWHTSSNSREDLIIRPGQDKVNFDAQNTRKIIKKRYAKALRLRSVCAGGDGSTEMEMNASMNTNFDFSRYGVGFVASPRHADALVISGPVTKAMDEALRVCYDAMSEPKLIILSGSDAIAAAMYEGSESVERSFLSEHDVDLYIPGNPVHPLTFIDAIMTLCDRKKR
ncbi:MAG: NADH:ubiquinone oxidoreductase [Rikenellaceae bacterium]